MWNKWVLLNFTIQIRPIFGLRGVFKVNGTHGTDLSRGCGIVLSNQAHKSVVNTKKMKGRGS